MRQLLSQSRQTAGDQNKERPRLNSHALNYDGKTITIFRDQKILLGRDGK